jgi:hypothetical protein
MTRRLRWKNPNRWRGDDSLLRPVEPVAQPRHTDPQIRSLMIGRLQRLERMGLATNAGPSQWVIGVDAETTLRDLAIRSDIIKTMHKVATDGVDRPIADYTIHGSDTPLIGRLVAKGLHDELTGEAYAVSTQLMGAHHVRFRDVETLELAPPIGGIVEVRRIDVGAQRGLTLASRSDLPIKAQIAAVVLPGSTASSSRARGSLCRKPPSVTRFARRSRRGSIILLLKDWHAERSKALFSPGHSSKHFAGASSTL